MSKILEGIAKPFRRFQVKVTVAMIVSLLFIGALSNVLIYQYTVNSQFNALRERLMTIAQISALMVDPDLLSQVPLNKDGVHVAEYKIIAGVLNRIKSVNPQIKYIYTLTKTEDPGVWQFWVDPDPSDSRQRENMPSSLPGDRYRADRFPEMIKSYNGASADKKLEIDEWGVTLSGYAPILDREGRPIAILGVDMAAEDVYAAQKKAHERELIVVFFALVVSLLAGAIVSRRITAPLAALEEGTRHIALGDLQHQVEIDGDDEINELAGSFNQMSKSLEETRKRLVNYFYDVVRSLVKVLEVRDPYTRGHSEAVAEYSARIARKLGYPEGTVDLLRRMTLLHDIGKLGVQDNILNKPGPLSDEEWEVMRKHPIMGEEILKPILNNPEMLAVVRGHHERYDGKGYPDQLSRDNINIFAAIVSVADAYHAMTSERPYKSTLSREQAMGELKKHSGTQFHPMIVEVFLEILQERL